MSACGEIAAQSSVYIDWLFRPIEKKTYNLSLSLKYYPTPIHFDSYFGAFERSDEQGNYGDREGDDIHGNGDSNGNANSYESEYKINDWREAREERERERDHVEEGRGDGEEKGGSALTSFNTGYYLYVSVCFQNYFSSVPLHAISYLFLFSLLFLCWFYYSFSNEDYHDDSLMFLYQLQHRRWTK